MSGLARTAVRGRELVAASAALDGINLVEASAGTGKTHAITDLYVRLLLEKGFDVSQILVVTYTKAATAELGDRIRKRLARAHATVRGQVVEDPFLTAILDRARASSPDPNALGRRIRLAMQAFDEAPIYTIHGFCQRALHDAAFEGAQPFTRELLTDDTEVIAEAVRDFWRGRVAGISPLWAEYLLSRRVSPEALTRWIRDYHGKPYLRVDRPRPPPVSDSLVRGLESDYRGAYRSARRIWRVAEGAVTALLTDSPSLNRNRYRPDTVANRLSVLRQFFEPPADRGVPAPYPGTEVRQALARFSSASLESATNKGRTPPRHAFFDAAGTLAESAEGLLGAYELAHLHLLADLLAFANENLAERNREARVHTYNDLLNELWQALQDDTSERLARALAARYPCALIDEFQDTDPIQLEIFTAIYQPRRSPAVSVFLVGDPKQAIFGFRGADVFAYLTARDRAVRRHTLSVNRRSVPGLVDAVNALFTRRVEPFVFSQIAFQPAQHGGAQADLVVEGDDLAPFRVWWMDPGGGRVQPNKQRAGDLAVQSTAREIARLLAAGESGTARLADHPLTGEDIAVLVRTNEQGARIQQALERLGIRSVRPAQDDVLDSREATEVEVLLRAVTEPGREALVRAALSGSLIGYDARALSELQSTSLEWDRWLGRFHHWRELWQRHGFSRMYRDVLEQRAVAARVLRFLGGERRLTNLLHLGELLQKMELELHAHPEDVLRWFERRGHRPGRSADESEQRLESDAALVHIVTIHGAKGLQYPVVFCPFAWDARPVRSATPVYHDPGAGFRAVLDLTGGDDPKGRERMALESLSDSLRLLYVALTRAQQRCYLLLGPVSQIEYSALGWLFELTPASPGTPGVKRSPGLGDRLRAAVYDWQDRAGGAVRIDAPPAGAVSSVGVRQPPPRRLSARTFHGDLAPRWGVSSFTGLTSDLPAELPDHDAAERAAPLLGEPGPSESTPEFPRGARAGTSVHAVLERIDFAQPVTEQMELVGQILVEHGLTARDAPAAARMVHNVLQTPLDDQGGIRLGALAPEARAAELEFYFPIAGFVVSELVRRTRQAGYLRWGNASGVEWSRRLSGFLKGYIDLVFCHAGRYYLVDYKSHWLGAGPDAYGPGALAATMEQGHYALQYLIYLAALCRYLRTRVPRFSYRTHIGGVFYLFVRGMVPGSPGSGVYFDRPSAALMADLDRLLGGTPASSAGLRSAPQFAWP